MIFIFLMHVLLKKWILVDYYFWLKNLQIIYFTCIFFLCVLNVPPHMIILRQGQRAQCHYWIQGTKTCYTWYSHRGHRSITEIRRKTSGDVTLHILTARYWRCCSFSYCWLYWEKDRNISYCFSVVSVVIHFLEFTN